MRPAQAQRTFAPHPFLATAGEGRKTMVFSKKQAIFVQGDRADTIFYLQIGKVKLTVLSQAGKEATLGILSDGSFFGEGSLAAKLFAWLRDRDDRMPGSAHRKESHGAIATSGTRARGYVREVFARPECPLRRRPD